MKNLSKLSSIILLSLLISGCASRKPAAPKPTDSRIEAPVETQSGSDVEVHGYISTGVGATFK